MAPSLPLKLKPYFVYSTQIGANVEDQVLVYELWVYILNDYGILGNVISFFKPFLVNDNRVTWLDLFLN